MVYEKTFRKTGFRDAGNWRGAAGDQSGKKVLIFSQFYATGLLCLANAVIVTLNIRNITKGNRDRISHFIRNSNTVQTCRKLTGICSRDK